MASHYIYSTIIFHDTSNVVGIDVTQNDLDVTDFETNNQSSVSTISSLVISETAFIIKLSYTDFDGKIDGTIVKWTDVKLIDNGQSYELILVWDSEL